jgi:cytochrome c peroxidase
MANPSVGRVIETIEAIPECRARFEQGAALSPEQQAGSHLFSGKACCCGCHLVGPEWALFTDNHLHNVALTAPRMHDGSSHSCGR